MSFLSPEYLIAISVLITALGGIVFGASAIITTSRQLKNIDETVNHSSEGIREIHLMVNSQREHMVKEIQDLRDLVSKLVEERHMAEIQGDRQEGMEG